MSAGVSLIAHRRECGLALHHDQSTRLATSGTANEVKINARRPATP